MNSMSSKFISLTLCVPLLALTFISGCGTVVTHTPSILTPVSAPEAKTSFTLTKQANILLDTGYTRTLNVGSQWRRIGSISQGDVYRPQNVVFTVEGKHIHEAYLVINNNQLIGFYLPYEHGFSPLAQPVGLTFSTTP